VISQARQVRKVLKAEEITYSVTVLQNLYLLRRIVNGSTEPYSPSWDLLVRTHVEREFMFMSKLRLLTAISILVTVGAISGQRSAIADEKDKLVGTWKLVSGVSEELETGQKTDIYKGTPTGFITYGSDGRVMTIIVDSNRKKPAGAVATSAEAEALFRSMAAYAGTYSVRGNQVIHRPDASWNETWTGTDQVRDFKFDGDGLSLATEASPNPFTGKMSVRILVWEKIK